MVIPLLRHNHNNNNINNNTNLLCHPECFSSPAIADYIWQSCWHKGKPMLFLLFLDATELIAFFYYAFLQLLKSKFFILT